MTDKLTGAEVKKALEWHLNEVNHCDGCPLFVLKNTTTYCVDVLMQNALDLINRLGGMNEKNENIIRVADKTIATLNAENETLKAEVERLNNNISAMAITLSTSARATRHEAYKEFANELKCRTHEISYNTMQVVNKDDIDNLLNELVGDGDGKRKD